MGDGNKRKPEAGSAPTGRPFKKSKVSSSFHTRAHYVALFVDIAGSEPDLSFADDEDALLAAESLYSRGKHRY